MRPAPAFQLSEPIAIAALITGSSPLPSDNTRSWAPPREGQRPGQP